MSFNRNRGFTLIEMMIVIAILGVLAAIATIGYLNYLYKSKVSVAYREVSSLKVSYDYLVIQNAPSSRYTPNGVNYPSQTSICNISLSPPSHGLTDDAIRCDLYNHDSLKGMYISLSRSANGKWHCKVSNEMNRTYVPEQC